MGVDGSSGTPVPRRLRLADVAARVGLSPASVSLVLRGEPGPNEATRRCVQEAADALGYRPDRTASLLAVGAAACSSTCTAPSTPSWSRTAEPGRRRRGAQRRRPGGRAGGRPPRRPGARPDRVRRRRAGRHRRRPPPRLPRGAAPPWPRRPRGRGARRADRGLGSAAAERLLRRGALPTAVVAYDDRAALGLLDALARAGVEVPGQVSVAGYDDTPLAAPRPSTSRRSARGAAAGRAGGRGRHRAAGRPPGGGGVRAGAAARGAARTGV